VATKTPAKGKKPTAAKDGAAKKTAAPKAREPEPAAHEDDDEEEVAAAPTVKKAAPKPRASAEGGEPPAVVPARRLTPEAKAQVNAMVQKGMSLAEALKAAASWETFVAPVKEEPAKLVQGKAGEPGQRPAFRRDDDDDGPDGDEEPAGESED
jgi:hypothetical protein